MDSDQKLNIFGELLANKTSRRIIELISDEELYLNEITNDLNIRTAVTIYHVKKLMKLEMVTVIRQKLFKRAKLYHKYYKMKPQFHIVELRRIVGIS